VDDTEAIKQLKARYFRTMDTKDWAGMRQVFTDDVVVDTTDSGGASSPALTLSSPSCRRRWPVPSPCTTATCPKSP
jgi:hypothetical protein